MVILPGHILAVTRLVRLPNLLIVAATQILIRYFIILPLLKQGNMSLQLSGGFFALLVISTVLITAGGYAINDYFDRKTDRVNKPGSLIVGKLILPRHAMIFHLIFTITGILIGLWISARTGLLYLSLVYFMVSGLLWFYSTTYKKEVLLGNIIVALLTALVPFMVLLYELPLLARQYGSTATPMVKYLLIWVLGFSLFAFLLNLIREIIKDSEDIEGDRHIGKKTVPVVWGLGTARWLAISLLLISAVLLLSAWYFFIPDLITLLYFIVLLIIPILVVTGFVFRGKNSKSFHYASMLLKIIMIAGLIYMIAVNLIINRLL